MCLYPVRPPHLPVATTGCSHCRFLLKAGIHQMVAKLQFVVLMSWTWDLNYVGTDSAVGGEWMMRYDVLGRQMGLHLRSEYSVRHMPGVPSARLSNIGPAGLIFCHICLLAFDFVSSGGLVGVGPQGWAAKRNAACGQARSTVYIVCALYSHGHGQHRTLSTP